ncbi:rhamnogalacturonan acetylesterase [Halalkalibacter sp. APA_J-10(15)]|uniref:rhamnogalacturonan acetylesterase n=1 Tax=Halalkalibacter sp. APA_J-10(15) TaxID=2933805 RepID=UPI001FF46701|nr:rhamnogalacturonan acetylesterase [Halalkalibacter sp. APA_J-10(15)]MCK0471589.1 rhamnogalacturonan acetylesterase [Halalkalibacter sp. APA_J-10(15)]
MQNIHIVGDSTVSSYEEKNRPQAGWGEMLQELLPLSIKVYNHAASGRSSKSFIDEGRLEAFTHSLNKGDLLLIQFGHNDEKEDQQRRTEPYTTFQAYLTKYIEEARKNEAIPILMTPVERRHFNEDGLLLDTHGEYPVAIKKLSTKLNTPLIDLTEQTRKLLKRLGPAESKRLFLWLERGEHPNYKEGIQDDTHFCEFGAREIAMIVCKQLHTLKLIEIMMNEEELK